MALSNIFAAVFYSGILIATNIYDVNTRKILETRERLRSDLDHEAGSLCNSVWFKKYCRVLVRGRNSLLKREFSCDQETNSLHSPNLILELRCSVLVVGEHSLSENVSITL
jgi:hypothetical protein